MTTTSEKAPNCCECLCCYCNDYHGPLQVTVSGIQSYPDDPAGPTGCPECEGYNGTYEVPQDCGGYGCDWFLANASPACGGMDIEVAVAGTSQNGDFLYEVRLAGTMYFRAAFPKPHECTLSDPIDLELVSGSGCDLSGAKVTLQRPS